MSVTLVNTEDSDHTGWGFPINSRKAHYFDAGYISLCGRWLFRGPVTADDGERSMDDCSPCRKKLAAATGRQASKGGLDERS